MRPFYAVEGDGFRQMVKILNPACDIKTRKVYLNIVKQKYTEALAIVKSALKAANYFALTFDLWTSLAKHAYITVTCHWIDSDFNMQHAVLGTQEMLETHDATNIVRRVENL